MFRKKDKDVSYKEKADLIEAAVYDILKPMGFRKHGRTLHRFVSEDISQVVHFQIGPTHCKMNHLMWVNIGIRIPECDRVAMESPKDKPYYQEHECTIRCRLGEVSGGEEKTFDLRKSADKITAEIVKELVKYILPAFEVLSSREAILAHRRDYPKMDSFKHLMLLDEALIYLHLGDRKKAAEAFEEYYDLQLIDYEDTLSKGKKVYLPKGCTMLSGDEKINAEKSGWYTTYTADDGHIRYLEELRGKLGLSDDV